MTQTAPEQFSKIAAPGDRVIITIGFYDGHQGHIELINDHVGLISVRMDVTGELVSFAPESLVYPDGSHPETDEERAQRVRAERERQRTAKRLHSHTRTLRPVMRGRESAIVAMAARYGAAERLKGSEAYDLDLSYRAADRRFRALQRLVYGD